MCVKGSRVSQAEGKPGQRQGDRNQEASQGSWKQFHVVSVQGGLSGCEPKLEAHRPYERV